MKKVISLILSVLMVALMLTPMMATAANNPADIPIIYIVGKQNSPVYKLDENGNWALDENGKRIAVDSVNTPLGMSRGEYIKTQVEPVLKELLPAFITGDYSKYVQALTDATAPIYKDLVLNEDGIDTDSSIDWNYAVQQPSKGAGGFKYYYFKYDWRYSPYDTADELHQFVEYICAKEKVEKVNIHARCYGSNVAMAYIAKSEAGFYDTPFRMNNLILNTTPLDGYIVIGSLMSGSIKLDADSLDRFVAYYLAGHEVFDDPLMETIAVVMVSVLNLSQVLGWTTDQLNAFLDKFVDDLVPKVALVSYGTFPSYWSMIGDKYFDKAKLAVFGTTKAEGEYANFITKLNNYHNLLGDIDEATGKPLYASVLKRCEANYGMKTAIMAKYGYATVPLFEGSNITGDARGTVTELSLGALGTEVGSVFTDAQLKKIKADENYNEKYLSPDKKVYAGTCLFPETTWFSKNLYHDQLNQIDPIATAFFLSDGALTVDNDLYPQFHEYVDGQFVPVSEEDETNDVYTNNPFKILYRFISMLLQLFSAIAKGEFEFKIPDINIDLFD